MKKKINYKIVNDLVIEIFCINHQLVKIKGKGFL